MTTCDDSNESTTSFQDSQMSSQSSPTTVQKRYWALTIMAKSRMQPTTRSVITEMVLLSLGITFAVVHALLPTHIPIMCISGISLIISGIIWFYFEVHKKALRCVMSSFRGFIITICIITVPICDVSTKYIAQTDQPIYIILIDDMCWATAILVLCGADCCPRITNFFRFVGPVSALMNAIHNVFVYNDDPETVLFEYKFGQVTIPQIEKIATIELILFSASFIMGLPRDKHHQYFVVLNNRIPKKSFLPHLNVATETTNIFNFFDIQTKWLFIILVICAVLAAAFNLLNIERVGIIIAIDCMVIIAVFLVICALVHCYFHAKVLRLAITQFRCNMLGLSVLIIIYVGIQEVIWELNSQKILTHIILSMGAFLLLIRDGLSITYPFYFTVFLSLFMFLIGVHTLYLITFIYDNRHQPEWFVWLEREAFYQVIVVCALILWNVLVRDRENRYFTLIRERKQCKELFYDTDELYMFDSIDSSKL